MRLAISSERFAGIQAKMGLDDAAMGRALYRTPDGPDLVRQLRTGVRSPSTSVSLAMIGFEEAMEASAAAA